MKIAGCFLFLYLIITTQVCWCRLLGNCFLNGEISSLLARSNNVNFCENEDKQSSLIFGAFTNTQSIGILCHKNTNGQIALFDLQNAQLFPPARSFCENGTQVLSADLNGDKIDDLLCHKKDGSVTFLLNTGVGGFLTVIEGNIGKDSFCKKAIFSGDLNNDGKDDIICHDQRGYIYYVFANEKNVGVSSPLEVQFNSADVMNFSRPWCNGTRDLILKGDLNADGRVDLLCHASRSKLKSALLFSSERNQFEEEIFENEMDFCQDEQSFMLVRDINGDGYQDLVCKSPSGGTKILLNRPGAFFTDQSLRSEFRFCEKGGKKNFFVADINKDGLSDLICQTTPGQRYIFLSRCYYY